MTTKQMEYILELAQTLNFNRAAENLYISQPTLTYQIHSIEEELHFRLFDRSGKGAALTPAGAQFVSTLRSIYQDLQLAIWQGQNFSQQFQNDLRIGIPIRSALHFLPKAIDQMMQENPNCSISPMFNWYHVQEAFLKGELDLLFSVEAEMHQIPDIKKHHLFDSHIYLVCRHDDVLANKKLITTEDLKHRTLMIGGPSQAPLRKVQNRVLEEVHCDYFNSPDHDTSLTNVAAKRAIVLSPGFLNDHTNEFVWIPFACEEVIPCALYTHASDQRALLFRFITIIQSQYPHDYLY